MFAGVVSPHVCWCGISSCLLVWYLLMFAGEVLMFAGVVSPRVCWCGISSCLLVWYLLMFAGVVSPHVCW